MVRLYIDIGRADGGPDASCVSVWPTLRRALEREGVWPLRALSGGEVTPIEMQLVGALHRMDTGMLWTVEQCEALDAFLHALCVSVADLYDAQEIRATIPIDRPEG